jgi:lipopolysaccharide exporter
LSAYAGIRWTGAATVAVTGLQAAQLAAMAATLDLRELGLYAIAQFVVGLAQTFTDLGIGGAAVQRPTFTWQQRSSLHWFGLASALIFGALTVAAGPVVAHLFREPELRDLIPLAALLFVIPWTTLPFQWMLQRELAFATLARLDVLTALVSLIVTVATAKSGFGALSPLLGQISGAAMRSLGLTAAAHREWFPQWHYQRSDLDGFLRFGLFQLGERLVNYLNTRSDQMVIGSWLGTETLGVYSLSYNLVSLPIVRLTSAIYTVGFPVLARVQHDAAALRARYLELLSIDLLVTAPVLFGASAIAERAMPLLLPGEDAPISTLFVRVLALVTVMRAMLNPTGALIAARGRAELGFTWNLSIAVIHPLALALACHWGGSTGLLMATGLLQAGYTLAAYPKIIRPLLGPCGRDYFRTLARPCTVAAAMGGAVWMLDRAAAPMWLPLHLVIDIAAGALLYGSGAWFLLRADVERLRGALIGRTA